MRQLKAFTIKEILEQIRTKKVFVLIVVFVLFGIMNPFIAKIMPYIFSGLSGSFEDQGLSLSPTFETNALSSWTQYYKNLLILFIVMIVVFSGCLTTEYQKGTLVNMLTKGLLRWKVVVSKIVVQIALWSICYWLAYAITYAYTCYFWDNSIVSDCTLAALMPYLLGVWAIFIIMFASVLFSSNTLVLSFILSVFIICYLLGINPDFTDWLPTRMLSSYDMLVNVTQISDYLKSIYILAGSGLLSLFGAICVFNKKKL